MSIIDLEEVSKLFGFGDAATIALDEISLTVKKGEFVAIMGPSGSGKTTLLNIIGLLDRPTHGIYKLEDKSIARLRSNQLAKARRDNIGFIFQSFHMLPRMTVIENVALPLAYKGMTPVRRLKAASRALERVGLNNREYFYPSQLSGGQLQRAAIARALVNSPNIIIADEPTGNLDSVNSRVVMELLADIHKTGNTVLLVTHNPDLTRYAERVIYMHDGNIIYDQASPIGTLPAPALKAMRNILERSQKEEEDLAGVSAMMNTIPDKPENKTKAQAKKAKKAKKKSIRLHPKIARPKRKSTIRKARKK